MISGKTQAMNGIMAMYLGYAYLYWLGVKMSATVRHHRMPMEDESQL